MDEAPPAPPINVAGAALADELAPTRLGQRRQMRVGEMGEGEPLIVMAGLAPAIPLMMA
jgi:hypothetical protein